MDAIDVILGHIAQQYAGAFTLERALAAGVSKSAVMRRQRRGVIQRLHPGVYFYGKVVTTAARRWAAVLAALDDALLSGDAAADEWGISRSPSDRVEIITATRHRSLAGVVSRQSGTIHSEDRASCNGRPTTSVERTLVEIAGRRSVHQLCRTLREAAFRKLLDLPRLWRTIERNRNRVGVGRLVRAVVLHLRGDGGSDSGHEDRFARKLDRAGITSYRLNAVLPIAGSRIRVDVYIEHLNLAIEIDPDNHDEAPMRREDTLRSSLLELAGIPLMRVHPDHMDEAIRTIRRKQDEFEGTVLAR